MPAFCATIIGALVFVFASALPTGAIASPYGRSIVTNPNYPWRSIGKVQAGSQKCTGVLVSACHVATAAHCILNENTGRVAGTISFKPHFSQTWVGSDRFRHGQYDRSRQIGQDWAIFKLRQSIGRELGWIPPAQSFTWNDIAPGRFNAVGYSSDVTVSSGWRFWRSEEVQLTADEFVSVFGLTNTGVIITNATAWTGASGGPLFAYVNRAPMLFGVTSELRVRQIICPDFSCAIQLRAGTHVVASLNFAPALNEMMAQDPCP
jgi:hypothetical protein